MNEPLDTALPVATLEGGQAEEGSAVTFTATLSEALSETATVEYSTVDDVAVGASDFTAVSAETITFNAGETSKTFTIATTQDTTDEDDESFSVQLSNPSANIQLGPVSSAGGLIINNDETAQTDATVSSITLVGSDGTTIALNETFNRYRFEYTATAGSEVSSVHGTVAFRAGATPTSVLHIHGNGGTATEDTDSTDYDADYSLAPGPSMVKFMVTSADTSRVKIYLVVVSKDASQDATLKALDLEDGGGNAISLSPVFTTGTTSYTASVGNTVDSVTVTPVPTFSGASVSVSDGTNTRAGGESFDLAVGATSLDVTVTAEDGVTTGDYEVVVTRAAAQTDDPKVSFVNTAYTVAEGAAVTVEVALDEAASSPLTIPLTSDGQGGATTSDYSGVPASVTFSAGDTLESFSFSAVQDTVDDDDESVKIGFGALPAGVSAGTANETVVRIGDDDDPQVTVTFGSAAYSVEESDDAGTSGVEEHRVEVTVTLSADPERTVTIPLIATIQDGASSSDYSGVPASVTFNSGDPTSKSFTFTATADAVDDDDESVKLTFGSLPTRVSAGTTTETVISIVDDDVPEVGVTFGASSYSIDEGDADGKITITVELDAPPEREVTIPLTKMETGATSSDYSGVPANIVFGVTDTQRTFDFFVTNDTADDDDESVKLTFGTLPTGVSAGTPNETVVSIVDDDVPEVQVSFGSAAYSVAESDDASTTGTEEHKVEVTVTLSADPERTVTISLIATIQDGASSSDYSGVPASVTFNSGDPTSKSFTFTATADTVDDDGESVKLTFGALPTRVTTGTIAESVVSIVDDDVPEVKVSFEQASYTASEGTSVKIKVKLDADPERAVTIPLIATNQGGASSSDYSGVPASVTFNSGETEQELTFTAADDDVDDDNESVVLTFDAANLPERVSEDTTKSTTVEITDGDVPDVQVSFEQSAYTAVEGGAAVTVTVALDADPERTVTIDITTSDQGGASGDDYSRSATSVTFNSGDTEEEFTFTATQDTHDDDGESVILGFPSTLPTRVTAGTTATATVSLTDDDTLAWMVTASPVSIAEDGASSTLTVATGGVTFETDQTIALTLAGTATGGDDYTIEDSGGTALTSPYSLTLEADTSEVTATIASVDDGFADGDETVEVEAAHGGNAIGGGATIITIEDDETVSDEVTLSVTTAQVGESAGATDIAVTGTLNHDPSPVDVVVALSFSAGTATDGTDYSGGAATLTIPAGSKSATAAITLTPRSDTLNEADETVTIEGMATGLTVNGIGITITDDDAPAWSVSANPDQIQEAGGVTTLEISTGAVTFATDRTITLSAGSASTATAGTDFTLVESDDPDDTPLLLPHDLTLSAGEDAVSVDITGIDDSFAHGEVTIVLEATLDSALIGSESVALLDDETPSDGIVLAVVPDQIGESDGATMLTVTGTLNGAPLTTATDLSLRFGAGTAGTTATDDDYTGGTATLTIPAGETSATAELTLTPRSDDIDESDETLAVEGEIVVAPGESTTLTVTSAEVTITDDDTRGVSIDPVLLEIAQGRSGSFEVVLGSEPTDDVRVAISLPDDSGLNVDKATLTFTGDTWDTPQAVTVTAGSDQGTVTITFLVEGGDYEEPLPGPLPSLTVSVTEAQGTVLGGSGFAIGALGGGPSGPAPSEAEFEWNVERDIEELDGDNDTPAGSWSDGATLWILDNASGAGDAIYAYDLESGERQEGREFALDETNRAPRGAWSDGTTMWVSDSGQDRLFAYDPESGERDEGREIELAGRNSDPRGIWSDEHNMWVLNGNPSLFAYDLASGEQLTRFSLDPANSDPRGIWSDGVSVWVSDDNAKKLFTYRLPVPTQQPRDGEEEPAALKRVTAEEFDEPGRVGNNSPRGIWSDGAVMYVADENDDKVYSYNMPDAIDARLVSLTLSGIEIGEFAPAQREYEGVPDNGVASTTVEAQALQPGATVALEPGDADEDAEGHQVELAGIEEIVITVTSPDGSRERTYRVHLGEAAEAGPSASCLRGAVAVGFSLVLFEGGSLDDLVSCAQGRHVTALYALHEGEYVSYIVGAPDFVTARFRALFADGVPALLPLVVSSEGPATPAPAAPEVTEPFATCLQGEIAAGFSLVVYGGGSVADLEACAAGLGVTAIYALVEGEYVSYILGAPEFVTARFRGLFPDGVPVATPLTVRGGGS